MILSKDNDLKKYLEKINLLEHIHKNSPCSVKELKNIFKISKSELFRKIEEWTREGLLIKHYENTFQ